LLTQFRKCIGLLPTLYTYHGDDKIKHYNIAKNDVAFKTYIFCDSKPTLNLVLAHMMKCSQYCDDVNDDVAKTGDIVVFQL